MINIVRYDLIGLKGTLSLDIRIERTTFWIKTVEISKNISLFKPQILFWKEKLIVSFCYQNTLSTLKHIYLCCPVWSL